MSLVRWNPGTSHFPALRTLGNFTDFDREFGEIFKRAFGNGEDAVDHFAPAMDWIENDDHYLVRLDLPGLGKDDVEVTLHDGVLTVKAEKTETSETKDEGRYVRRERYSGSFLRSVRVPEKVDAHNMEATFRNGVLELKLPFVPETKPTRLQIKD